MGAVGFPYSTNFTATGGTLPYVWAWVSGTLQSGLSLNGNVLSGTPGSAATASFKIKVTGCNGLSSTNQFSLTVETPPTITTSSPLSNGTVDQSYGPLTFTVNGGTGSYNWSLTSGGLPAGMSLNSSGVLSGTPTTGTTTNFSVKVTDAYSFSSTKSFSLTVSSTITITTSSTLPNGMAGRYYDFKYLQASGSQLPYTWSWVSGKPSWLTLDTTDGELFGTPPTSGPFTFTVDVADKWGNLAQPKSVNLTVSSALVITTSATLLNGNQYQAYSTSFTATGGSGSYTWTSGNLPAWLSLSGSGVLSGTPTSGGAYSFTAQVSDGSFSTNQTFYLTVNAAPVVATPMINPASETVTNQSVPVTMSCATPGAMIRYTTDGTDPNGSTQTYSPFIISQPPTGSLTVTVKAIGFTNGYNQSAEATAIYTIIIAPTGPAITTTSPLSTGTAGTFYGPLTFTATGGTGSYNWSRVSGILPPGLTLTSGGLLSGTPTNSGTYNFMVQVKDRNNASDTKAFNLTMNPATILSGGLAGRVLGNGSPIANAQVRIENMTLLTNTISDGTFILSNVPVGNGYVLDISAAGYNSTRLTGVNVVAGGNALSDITLTSVGGPYTLREMANVDPAISTVEQGGTAYRYYCVLNASGNPQGGIAVSAQTSDGTLIPQNDTSSYWPGTCAGTSDGGAYGTVRIAVPSSVLNQSGIIQTVQLSIAGQVQRTFQTQVVPRQYDQVWKQAIGGGVGVDFGLQLEGDTSAESELRHTIIGGVNTVETISRSREEKLKVGLGGGFDVGLSEKVSDISPSGGASIGASGGIGDFIAIVLKSDFYFNPNTTDSSQNLMKLYVDLGNVLTGTPIGNQLYNYADTIVAPLFLANNFNSAECDIQVGAYAEGELDLAINDNQQDVKLAFGGSASGDLEDVVGYKMTFGTDNNSASILGFGGNASAVAGIGFSDSSSTIGEFSSFGLGGEQDELNWAQKEQAGFEQPQQIAKMQADAGTQNPFPAWQKYDPTALNANYAREFTEAWVVNGTHTNYERSVFASEVGSQINFNMDLIASLNFNLELDRGAEVVNERGVVLPIYQFAHWPTESYPALTTDLFPTQTWPSILSQWETYASGPIGSAINQTITTIENAGNTIAQAGQATLNIAGGALNSGAQVVSSWASDISHISLAIPAGKAHPLGGPVGNAANYLPPDGSSNYVYGIDGVYRFTSTNAFNGTATLAIPYNPADVTGLDPAQLQIYQLPDGTNRWQLVGGVVDTVSNTVTVTITNLGTFAVAPPLPTGSLQLVPSTNALPADDVSTMTVVVSNLMLNNGNVATQQWLFTATATGVQIVNPDCDTNLDGIQVVSTNGTVSLLLQAPSGGTAAQINLASVAGDANGSVKINLIDTTPPATPTNVVVTAGQSRIWVSWQTNSEPDLASYRVYYLAGQDGPHYDGTAAIEGSPSPVQLTGTNCLLRGLTLGTNYFVAVSAVDTSGNESPMSAAIQVTTVPSPPMPPTGVAARFDGDGTNVIVWGLSEDDGYNDRDVTEYYIWRAILPDGSYRNIGQVAAGVGIYTEPNPTLALTQSVSYAVSAITGSGSNSTQIVATVVPPSNVVSSNATIVTPQVLSNGNFQFGLQGLEGQTYIVQTSTNLVNWTSGYTNSGSFIFIDSSTTNCSQRFYRVMMQ